jgi:hypothetical protein
VPASAVSIALVGLRGHLAVWATFYGLACGYVALRRAQHRLDDPAHRTLHVQSTRVVEQLSRIRVRAFEPSAAGPRYAFSPMKVTALLRLIEGDGW